MKKSVVVFAVILLLVVAFQNCAPSNFNTTGPVNATQNASTSSSFISGLLVESVCHKISSCVSGLDISLCQSQVNTLPGLPQKFGVTAPALVTMADVVVQERNRALTGSGAYSVECTTALQGLACNDQGLAGAYDHTSGSFAGVSQLIGELASCAQVY